MLKRDDDNKTFFESHVVSIVTTFRLLYPSGANHSRYDSLGH